MKPSELRKLLKSFIEELWGMCPNSESPFRSELTPEVVNSDTDRAPATVPWHLLERIEPLKSPLQDSPIISAFPNLNPAKLTPSDLFRLAQALSNADHGVIFKKSTSLMYVPHSNF